MFRHVYKSTTFIVIKFFFDNTAQVRLFSVLYFLLRSGINGVETNKVGKIKIYLNNLGPLSPTPVKSSVS